MKYLCTRRKLGPGRSCMLAARGRNFGPASGSAAKPLITHNLGVSLNARRGLFRTPVLETPDGTPEQVPLRPVARPFLDCYYFTRVIEEDRCHGRAGAKN